MSEESGKPTATPQGDVVPEWKQGLPAELQTSPALKDVNDVGSLAKQFVDQQQFIGRSVRVPGEDAGADQMQQFYDDIASKVPGMMVKPNREDPDAMNAFYKTMGRPEEASGYEMPTVEGAPVDEERAVMLKALAHKYGIGAKEFTGMIGEVLEMDKQGFEAHNAQIEATRTELKKEWGEAFDQREQAVLTAAKNSGAPKELVDAIETGKMRGESLKWLFGLMSAGSETRNFAEQHGVVRVSPDEAEAQLNEMYDNPEHPIFHKGHPGHKAAMRKVLELQQKIEDAKNAA